MLFFVVTFLAFTVIVVAITAGAIRRMTYKRTDAVVFRIALDRESEKKAVQMMKKATFPLAFDIVVQHLGTKREHYVVTDREHEEKALALMKDIWPYASAEISDDYLVFHHGGAYDAFRVTLPFDDFNEKDITAVELHSVNEIGEGAVVRFFHDPSDKEGKINVLALFSAPSQFQLREIESAISEAFKGRKIYSPRDKEELFRIFNSPEGIAR